MSTASRPPQQCSIGRTALFIRMSICMAFESITRADIEAAWDRIQPHVRVTPVMRLNGDLLSRDADIFMKFELMQVTGSFKPRGAFNRILSNTVPGSGIIAASGGNHGLATAYAA